MAFRRQPRGALVTGCLAVALAVAAAALASQGDWVETNWFCVVLATTFVMQIGTGVPVGFVLASVGILYVWSTGSARHVAIARTERAARAALSF